MRILVTGASGFIGSRVVRKLLQGGHEVAALIKPGSRSSRLADVSSSVRLIAGDLSGLGGQAAAEIAALGPDTCIHLAWYAEPGKYLDSRENLASLAGSLRLVDVLIECGCRHMVAAGTCAEYAESSRPLLETDPTKPKTLYAASKLSLCLVGQQLANLGTIAFAWGRIFYLYGPGEDSRRAVPALIRALLKGDGFPATQGEQLRDYLHVDDVARAFVTLAVSKASGVYNIASGNPVAMRELMQTVGHALGKQDLIRFGALPYRDWEPAFVAGDNHRLKSLGWLPAINLDEGLVSAADFWRTELARDRA